ncbi:MAG: hypothetical protein ABW328_02835 [Ilumatobacteraceae bacterium]
MTTGMARLRASTARTPPMVAVGWLLALVAVTPIVVGTLRALARGWIAVGDNGLLLLRTQDVATSDNPLLGTWTSASLGAGRTLSNPGPLWFDVLAPFVKVFGPAVGFAGGVMVANVAAVVVATWYARRAGGDLGMVLVTALSAGLAWTMGSELLFDAWQPHAMILPFWALLVVLWALGTGHLGALPWAVGLASLLVQTHLSYVFVVAVLGVVTFATAALVVRRDIRSGVDHALRRPLLAATGVAVAVWIQPVIDQLVGEGNLAALVSSSGDDSDRVGLQLGVRLVGSVVALPPWWTRPGFSSTIRPTGVFVEDGAFQVAEGHVRAIGPASAGLLVVIVVLGVAIAAGWRWRDRSTVVLGGLGVTAVGACLVSMTQLPLGTIGLSPHQMRWLWPVATLVLLVPGFALGTWPPARRAVLTLAAVATVLVSVLNLPTYAAPEGPTADRRYGPQIAALVDQLDEYAPASRVLVDFSGQRFGEPYSGPVLATLGRDGVDFAVAEDGMVRQVGGGRRADGREGSQLNIVEGNAALTTPAGSRRVAFVDGVTSAQRAELDQLRAAVITTAARTGLQLNERGMEAAAAGRIGFTETVLAPGGDAATLEREGWLEVLVRDGLVDVDDADATTFQRYAELAELASRFTVGIFERPLGG